MPIFEGRIAPVHEDQRRSISACNSPEGGFSIQSFVIKERIPLGNHYHAEKEETFIVYGTGELRTCDIDRSGSPIGPVQTHAITSESVYHIKPFTAHTFLLDLGSRMICFSSKPFYKNDKDMWPHKLV